MVWWGVLRIFLKCKRRFLERREAVAGAAGAFKNTSLYLCRQLSPKLCLSVVMNGDGVFRLSEVFDDLISRLQRLALCANGLWRERELREKVKMTITGVLE